MGSHPGRVHRRGPEQDRRLALRGRGAKLGCSLFGQSLRPVSVSMRATLLSPSQSFLKGSRSFTQQPQYTQVLQSTKEAPELRRITLPRTPVNKGKNEGTNAARFTTDICVVRT